MSKHQIEIKLTVTGSQVNLYLVNDSELSQLMSNSELDDPEPYYEIIQSDGYRIYSGIDPIDGDTSIEIFLDGNPIDVDGYSLADFEEEANEIRSKVKNKMIRNSENGRWLDGDIPKDMHALVVREYFKDATASITFESQKAVFASDFELIISSTDSSSDFSEVTYHADILPTECDLVGIIFDGVEAEPELHIDNFKDQEFFLFVRDAAGKLKLTNTNIE